MEYWKVLIADDEFIIRDGIMSSVNWGDFNMEVVAEAEDGEEAVDLAIRHEIDVLLIDLNMPIMNGITAMKKIKNQLHDCRMVVISGYDDFQYAQEAIRLQVEDYLLKPVNPNQLAGILGEVKQQLDQQRQEENYLQQASTQVKKNHKQLRNRFFLEWMSENLGEEEVKNQLQFLELPRSAPQSLIVMKWLDGEVEHHFFSEQERKQQLKAIEELLEEDMSMYGHAIFLEDTHWISILIWEQTPADLVLHLEEFIKKELAQHVYAKQIDVEFSNIPSKYAEVKQELNTYMQLSPLVKQSIQYIRKHYRDSHLTLESIAESLHVSTVYLSKMIKQDLGVSYVKLVTQMRLQAAKDLLKTTDLSIREIAERVGYDSQHYFSTAFRKSIGMTPKQYKHQL
ncbi:response regulator [Gracilibacillus lacisalsi]|uniref:response regulator n=1 Tax=Gracilibacillus lacisalsi TaxID=393087 RepID=UPI0003A5C336|nr:response regulator [Gracilibacillus lacisalsi]